MLYSEEPRGLPAGESMVYPDSSAGVAGIGIRPTSVGVFGQSYQGIAGQFVIDNSFVNSSNALEVSNSQTGNGIEVNVSNSARGINITQNGNGHGVWSNSFSGVAGRFENTNAANNNTTLDVNSLGQGRAIVGRSNFVGFINAGVIDGFTNVIGANAVFGRATRPSGWGIYGLSDSSAGVAGIGIRPTSVGVFGQSYQGPAGQFVIDNSFVNSSNALEVSNSQTGNGIEVECIQ